MIHAQATQDDDEQMLLTIAAIVLAFFVGLTAWLMAPDFFTQDPAVVSTASNDLLAPAAVRARAPAPREVDRNKNRPSEARSNAAPIREVQPAQTTLSTPAVQPTNPVAALETVAPPDATPTAVTAIVDAASSPEIFVETQIVKTVEEQVVAPPEPEAVPQSATATSQAVEASSDKSQSIATVLTEASSVVSFYTGSVVLTEESTAVLDKVAALMGDNPTKRLGIIGHTDALGGADANVKLSFARARACAQYLADKGVTGSRIDAAGMGEQMPLASNQTLEGRQQNRRVEFRLL